MTPIFRPGPGPFALAIAMTGVRLGERFLQIGSGTPSMSAAIASKVGVSGHAAAVDDTTGGAEALEQAAARAGVLVEVQVSASKALPFDADSFDLVVLDRTGMGMDAARGWTPEAWRVSRAGGRVIVAERVAAGVRGLFARPTADDRDAALRLLENSGFRPVRRIAERNGWRFTEGIKPRG